MKAEDTQTNMVVIVLLLIAIPLFIAATSIGNLSLRYLVSAIVPNRHVSEGIAKNFKDNPSQFEEVVNILLKDPVPEFCVSRNRDEVKVTKSEDTDVSIDKASLTACKALFDKKLGVVSIQKYAKGVSFSTGFGPHLGDGHSLIFSKEVLKQIDPIFGREYFTLNDHWAIQLI